MAKEILVTGAAGMLGSEAVRAAPGGVRPLPVTRADCDLAEPEHVELLFERLKPKGVLHCAGYTQVDRAEVAEEAAFSDNVEATKSVAAAARLRGIPMLLVSTDYVFDGTSRRPYREDDPPHPLNIYGRTKLEAEQAARDAIIVRSSWLYGPRGRHFVGAILEQATKPEIRVVDDQRGCPTSTLELAPVLWELLLRGIPGIYHAACEGSCTWHELALAAFEMRGAGGPKVVPCATAEYPRPAKRPAMSALDCGKLAAIRGKRLPHWRDALRRFLVA
ncbi:MAG: dTDP-4-dehydrorhamnose reductase [Planctomycetes bacterium]|nr:dTDP-4-dehydrorhamnose reductase [Planctomycetota bacterium]